MKEIYEEIYIEEIKKDDVLLVKTGEYIPVDGLIIEGKADIDESMITGESDAIGKKAGDFLYSGSFVVSGTAYARIENVGKNNYIEKMMDSLTFENKEVENFYKQVVAVLNNHINGKIGAYNA